MKIDHATSTWVEGLPLGNGDLGVMLYGGPERVTLGFNKSDVWDYRVGKGQGLPEETTTFDEMVAMAREGRLEEYKKLFASWLDHEDCSQPSLQPAGQLDLFLLPGQRATGFSQVLDLATATARIHCGSCRYREDVQSFDIETFVPAREDVIPVTITNNSGQSRPCRETTCQRFPCPDISNPPENCPPPPARVLFGSLRLSRPASPDYGPPQAWSNGDTAGLDMTFPGGLTYTLAVRVPGGRGRWETTPSEAVYAITPDVKPLALFVTITTSRNHADPRAAAIDRLKACTAETPRRLAAAHGAWWQEYWERSAVSLPDKQLEEAWYLGLYLFGSTSRPGKQAPGLQGVWNQYTRPTWHTDYHGDGNVEIYYWPAYTCNHLELAEPYYRLFMEEMIDEARRAARKFFKRRGMYFPIAGGPRGHELAAPWAWPAAGAWIAMHFWWGWLYSRDRQFLAKIYPFLKELSLFYEDFLTRNERGKYDYGPSFSPEMIDPRAWLMMVWGKNVTADLAFIRVLLTALIEGSETLGLDPEDRKRWQDYRDNLAEYPCKMEIWLDLEGDEFMALEVSIPRIVPIYPTGLVGLGSSLELQTRARRSLDRVRPIFGGGGHCGLWCASAAAHLGDAPQAVAGLRRGIAGRQPNGLNTMMQIDSVVSTPSGINTLLLQSLDGIIRIFPAVPREWADVSFTTLRAVGAFLVSAERRAGRTTRVVIHSEQGASCTMANPFLSDRARIQCGQSVTELMADATGHFRFSTERGATYDMTPVQGGDKPPQPEIKP